MDINSLKIVRVQDIILDDTHKKYKGEDDIGKILYTEINEPSPTEGEDSKDLPLARPLHYNISYYPVPNEIVYTILGPSALYHEEFKNVRYYLYPISIQKSPSSNALPDRLIENKFYQGQYFQNQELENTRKVMQRFIKICTSARISSPLTTEQNFFFVTSVHLKIHQIMTKS